MTDDNNTESYTQVAEQHDYTQAAEQHDYTQAAEQHDSKSLLRKLIHNPFFYIGTIASMLVGGYLINNSIKKADGKQDVKETPIQQKAVPQSKHNLKKAVLTSVQKGTAINSEEVSTHLQETATSNAPAEKTEIKAKTQTVTDYQFAIVPGFISEQVRVEPAVARELVKNFQLADAAMDSWVASKIQALKGNATLAEQYKNVALRQFPELAKCQTFQDVAFELYKKKMAAGIDTTSTRAKISYSYLTKAARATNAEGRLKHLYKAVTLTPEVGIMGPNLDVAHKIAESFKGKNHIILRVQRVKVPLVNEAVRSAGR